MNTINHVNAGIIHTQSRMCGLTLEQALESARHGRLHSDWNATPHRATIVRLLKTLWEREDKAALESAARMAAAEAFDAAVAAAYPDEWARAIAHPNSKSRRNKCRLLRKRYRLTQQEAAL